MHPSVPFSRHGVSIQRLPNTHPIIIITAPVTAERAGDAPGKAAFKRRLLWTGGSMDFNAEAERHREMAEECRSMAELLADEGLRVEYRALAEAYQRLAENELRVADNLKLPNGEP